MRGLTGIVSESARFSTLIPRLWQLTGDFVQFILAPADKPRFFNG
jgi:hypothetical protein